MDTAVARETGRIYTAHAVDQMAPRQRQALRGTLQCRRCSAIAWFRRSSRDGKRACFFATAHDNDCDYASPSSPRTQWSETVRRVEAAAEQGLVLRIDSARLPSTDESGATATTRSQPTSSRAPPPQADTKTGSRQRRQRTLRALLRTAVEDPDFTRGDALIATDAGYTWRACNIFVPFDEAEPDERRPHLYWGPVTDIADNHKWLNTGGPDQTSIDLIPLHQDPLGLLGVDDPDSEIPGAHVIVFGWCVEGRRGKPIIRIKDKDPAFIALEQH